MKRVLALALTMIMLFTSFPVSAFAEETADMPMISVVQIENEADNEISVNVNISPNSGACGGRIDISYDNELLIPKNYKVGEGLSGAICFVNLEYESDIIRISWAGTEEISADTICNLTFTVISAKSFISEIEIKQAKIADINLETISVYTEKGEITYGDVTVPSTPDTPDYTPGFGGGSYHKDPIETVVPTQTEYIWLTTTKGYKLKDKDGKFVTGWAKVNDDWYYLDGSGYMKTGWIKDGNIWYYLKSSGDMVDNGWYKVDNVWYYFGTAGAMKTGWVLDNGRWYYMKSSGAMAIGWVLYNGCWYYLDESGAMATGWKAVKGEWYYLDPTNGKMVKNTTVDGYKIGPDGIWEK